MDDVLIKLVEFVETASPVIWEAAQRQVYANIVVGAMWAVVMIVSVVGLVWASVKAYRKIREIAAYNKEHGDHYNSPNADPYEAAMIIGTITAIVLAVLMVVNITAIAKMAINPTYYAIQNIMGMVP